MALAGLMVTSLVVRAYAQQNKSIFELAGAEAKQTSKDFKPAPEKMKTRFGTLEFPGGYPTEETVRKVYDELDLQRATQLYLDMYPALSMHGIMKGLVRDYGVRNCSDIFLTANRLDSKALFLTGNTESIYGFILVDLKADGPTVIEVPPGVMGPFDDHNFKFVFGIGPTGKDQGKGGKYLVLPPDYDGDVPEGYFVAKSRTYCVWNFMRGYVRDSVKAAADNIKRNLKVYPLSKKDNPPKMEFVNMSGRYYNTIPPNDFSFYESLNNVIQEEPLEFIDPETRGQIASIGIVKGKPFNPDGRMRRILT